MSSSTKGEMGTLLTIGAVVLIGVSAVVSSIILEKEKNTNRTSAQEWKCPGGDCDKCGRNGFWGAGCDEFCATRSCGGSKPVDPNACPCDRQESCIGDRWCGNDCRYHDDEVNKNRCTNEGKMPTPIFIPNDPCISCEKKDKCVGERWCGNDCQYHGYEDVNKGCKQRPPTSTPVPTSIPIPTAIPTRIQVTTSPLIPSATLTQVPIPTNPPRGFTAVCPGDCVPNPSICSGGSGGHSASYEENNYCNLTTAGQSPTCCKTSSTANVVPVEQTTPTPFQSAAVPTQIVKLPVSTPTVVYNRDALGWSLILKYPKYVLDLVNKTLLGIPDAIIGFNKDFQVLNDKLTDIAFGDDEQSKNIYKSHMEKSDQVQDIISTIGSLVIGIVGGEAVVRVGGKAAGNVIGRVVGDLPGAIAKKGANLADDAVKAAEGALGGKAPPAPPAQIADTAKKTFNIWDKLIGRPAYLEKQIANELRGVANVSDDWIKIRLKDVGYANDEIEAAVGRVKAQVPAVQPAQPPQNQVGQARPAPNQPPVKSSTANVGNTRGGHPNQDAVKTAEKISGTPGSEYHIGVNADGVSTAKGSGGTQIAQDSARVAQESVDNVHYFLKDELAQGADPRTALKNAFEKANNSIRSGDGAATANAYIADLKNGKVTVGSVGDGLVLLVEDSGRITILNEGGIGIITQGGSRVSGVIGQTSLEIGVKTTSLPKGDFYIVRGPDQLYKMLKNEITAAGDYYQINSPSISRAAQLAKGNPQKFLDEILKLNNGADDLGIGVEWFKM